jgi:hypothetical protein
MKIIIQRIKEAMDRHKIYVDAHHVDRSYKFGDQVFLRVKSHKSSIKFGKGDKLSPSFMGTFKIVERKGLVAYRISLPDSLRCMHDVFHVSVLRHYIGDPTHVINMSSLQISDEGSLMDNPICNLDHHALKIRCGIVDQVKVQWDNYSLYSGT